MTSKRTLLRPNVWKVCPEIKKYVATSKIYYQKGKIIRRIYQKIHMVCQDVKHFHDMNKYVITSKHTS